MIFIPCSPKSLYSHIPSLGFMFVSNPNLALPTTFSFLCIISLIPGVRVCTTHISRILRKMPFVSPSAVTQIRVSVISTTTTSSSVDIRRAQTMCSDLLLNISAVAQVFANGYVWKSSTDMKKKDFNLDPDSSLKFYASSELDLSLLASSFLHFQRVGGKGSPKDSCRASEVRH